jgi:two-component system sensor histidine kinase KdpD
LLFVVGAIASAVASTSRHRANEATRRGRQAGLLRTCAHDVEIAGDPREIAAVTARTLAGLFRVPAVVMRIRNGAAVLVEAARGANLQPAEHEAALSSLTTGTIVRAGVYPADTSRFDFWPVSTAAGQLAVIGLAFDPDDRPAAPDVLVEIVAGFLALAPDRRHLRAGPATQSDG